MAGRDQRPETLLDGLDRTLAERGAAPAASGGGGFLARPPTLTARARLPRGPERPGAGRPI